MRHSKLAILRWHSVRPTGVVRNAESCTRDCENLPRCRPRSNSSFVEVVHIESSERVSAQTRRILVARVLRPLCAHRSGAPANDSLRDREPRESWSDRLAVYMVRRLVAGAPAGKDAGVTEPDSRSARRNRPSRFPSAGSRRRARALSADAARCSASSYPS